MSLTDHYEVLGLDRSCTDAQIRAAYRMLARQHHPDLNGGSAESVIRTQALNAAHEVLGDPVRREAYDREWERWNRRQTGTVSGAGSRAANIAHEVRLRLDEFIRGAVLEIQVRDPGTGSGGERYELRIPAGTVPGTRFRIARRGVSAGSQVVVRVKAASDSRFKVRGTDLRCDLRIRLDRAMSGGNETVRGVDGRMLRVEIPARVARGASVTLPGEGLPRKGGGRGALMVRIVYQPEVRVKRMSRG